MRNYLQTDFIAKSALMIISLVSVWGTFIYRFYSLNNYGILITLLLTLASYFILAYFYLKSNHSQEKNNFFSSDRKNKFFSDLPLAFVCFFVQLLLFYLLFKNITSLSIISPWQTLPNYFFLFYALALAGLMAAIFKKNIFTLALLISHYFLSFSAAIIVFKYGYGFDPFIHEATLNIIAEKGEIFPKPFYYLGQYSLVIIFQIIPGLTITWLNKFLVPILTAVFIPLALNEALKKKFSVRTASRFLIILLVLIFPYAGFIFTTPQGLAYLFLLLVIIYGLICKNLWDLAFVYILALAGLAAQPIAGLPALFFAMALTVYHLDRPKIKKYLFGFIFFLTVAALPISFYLVEKNQSELLGQTEKTAEKTLSHFTRPDLSVPAQENFWLNFIYLYQNYYPLLLLFLFLTGLLVIFKNKKEAKKMLVYLALGVFLLLSFFIASFLPFSYLIAHERSNFAFRLFQTAAFFTLPFLLYGLAFFLNKLFLRNIFIKTAFIFFFVILLASSFYLSYPRYDNYHNSRIYSVGKADIEAVNWINKDADKDYIVLANQQVSAAALREFGFKKYYKPADGKNSATEKNISKQEIFYYPIPTGGPLYQYYLDMVYKKPSRETALKAMALAEVELAYFVLNDYWWAADKLLQEAKMEADQWIIIEQGEIYIFKYKKSSGI